MTPAERLASLLSAAPRPTVEIVVGGQRFTARVRLADSMESPAGPLVEVLFGSIEDAPGELAVDRPLKYLEIPTLAKSDKDST